MDASPDVFRSLDDDNIGPSVLPASSSSSSSSARRPSDVELDGGMGLGETEWDSETAPPVPRAPRVRDLPSGRHKEITQEDVDLARKLWYWGFFLLPFLWLVNYVYYRQALYQPDTTDEMKQNVRRSLYAFIVAAIIWAVWLIVFYTNMHGWANPLLILSPHTGFV